jgi:radical SAM protein with 4Fe4S-binding SPASM domain
MKKIKIVNNYVDNRTGIKKLLSLEKIYLLLNPLILIQIKKITIDMMVKYLRDHYDLFPAIEIETINRCNNTCAFCPVNVHADIRPLDKMDESLFRKIMGELSEAKFHGYLGLQSNNEPYMDKNIISRIAYARQKCPKAFIHLYTNGTLLNTDKLLQSFDAGLSVITINNYNDDLKLNDNIKKIIKNIERSKYEKYLDKIRIGIRKKNEVLSNRGGIAPNKSIMTNKNYKMYWSLGCVSPFQQMVVRPNGEVSLCCQDAYGQITLGDTKTQSLKKIWTGPPYKALRKELLRNGRKNLTICNTCDVTNVDGNTLIVLVKKRIKKLSQDDEMSQHL